MEKQSGDSLVGLTFPSNSSYTFVREIGRGGYGIVYAAERNSGGVVDHVAIKAFRSLSEEQVQQLKAEIAVASLLRHDNIVKVYGIEFMPESLFPREFREDLNSLDTNVQTTAAPRPLKIAYRSRLSLARQLRARSHNYTPVFRHAVPAKRSVDTNKSVTNVVMDYVDGTNLEALYTELLRRQLLIPIDLGLYIVSRICRGLAYAHEITAHRNLSPQSMLITLRGGCKISDFGTYLNLDQTLEDQACKTEYMAPERFRRENVNAASDIFSLGLVAYQILTGIPYFRPPVRPDPGANREYVGQLMYKPIPPAHTVRQDIPRPISDILSGMLNLDPGARLNSVSEIGEMLEQWIYSKGFGPTSESLAAYLRLLMSNFEKMTEPERRSLAFLKDASTGRLMLKRPFHYTLYTQLGLNIVLEKQQTFPWKVFMHQSRQTQSKKQIG